MRTTTLSFQTALVTGVALITGVGHADASAGVRLTDVYQFSTASNGAAAGGQLWDTRPDTTFTIWVSANGQALNGAEPAASDPTVDFEMEAGSYSFQIWGQVGGAGSLAHAGMNLFFGDSGAPGISVFAAARADMGVAPAISANSSSTPTPAGSQAGSGSLSYFDASSGLTVTMTDWFYANPNVFNVDQVQGYSRTPGAGPDFYGEFTLRVVPVPGTAASLVAAGLLMVRRRR
ncbi:MAG: hypothetical protein AAF297_09880 [Planctomycetota bacterium]